MFRLKMKSNTSSISKITEAEDTLSLIQKVRANYFGIIDTGIQGEKIIIYQDHEEIGTITEI